MRINRPKYLILHHSAISFGSHKYLRQFWMINKYHWDKWNFKSSLGLYGGYHCLIEADGKVEQYRAEIDVGIHTKGMNSKSLGIALAGNFSEKDSYPTSQQLNSLKQLLLRLVRQYNIPLAKIVPHRYFKATECYGKNLKDDWGQRLAYQEIQKYPKEDIKRELLRTQISIIEKVVKLYIRLYAKLFG